MTTKPKVYFTKILTPLIIVDIYDKLEIKLQGNIAVKVHSGEMGKKNFLQPEFFNPIVGFVNGTVVEKSKNQWHMKTLKAHG